MNFILNNLYSFDYILLSITFLFVFFSIWKGFIQSILSLITWIGSILITLIFYQSLSNYLSFQMNKIDFMEYLAVSEIISVILSIPIIFIFSLIILRKIKTMISSDVDKASLGILLDKFFGIIYGFIFSYFIFSIMLLFFDQFNSNLLFFMTKNSFILDNINTFNQNYIIQHLPIYLENNNN